jgi:AcrR family transcriptional regulator
MVNSVAAGGKRQRTRAALIEAALAIAAEQGFEAVTLNAVAARVGMTKGAVYSNFRSKAQLLWEAAKGSQTFVDPKVAPGAPLEQQARAFARALLSVAPRFQHLRPFHNALQLYSATDPELQALQQDAQAALFKAIDGYLEREFGPRLTLPTRHVSLALQALVRGFLHQATTTPAAVTEAVVADAFEALLAGATAARTEARKSRARRRKTTAGA